MNLDMLKRSKGHRVQLEPPAIHLDATGRELPSRNQDWLIAGVTDDEVRLDWNGYTTTIGKDAVVSYNSNPSRSTPGGLKFGMLLLKVQMYVQGNNISYRPCPRPGERAPPLPVQLARMTVDYDYPKRSGIQERLEADGWRTSWCRESRVPTLELEGWEIVVEQDRHGMPTSFYTERPDRQVYVKTRQRNLHELAHNPYFQHQPGLLEYFINEGQRTIAFRFDSPVRAMNFVARINRGSSGLTCTIAPGSIDTAIVQVPNR